MLIQVQAVAVVLKVEILHPKVPQTHVKAGVKRPLKQFRSDRDI